MEELSLEERKTVETIYSNSLIGAAILFIQKTEIVRLKELELFVEKNYKFFRTLTGRKYTGKDYKKVVKGLLTNPIFIVDFDTVRLKVTYNQKDDLQGFLRKKCKTIINRQKRPISMLTLPEIIDSQKDSRKILMVEDFCKKLQQDPDYSKLFDEPFKVFYR